MPATTTGDIELGSADDAVRAQLEASAAALLAVPGRMAQLSSNELASFAALAARASAAAEAAQAAIVLEANSRGVIATSDHPRVNHWVEQSCRDAAVPVQGVKARQLRDIAAACDGHDVAALCGAVLDGRLALPLATTVAKVYRRLKTSIEYPHWDLLLESIVDWAADGNGNSQLAALEERLIDKYGTAEALDDGHAVLRTRRRLTIFHRDSHGMFCATLKLDPASEAAFSAAIQSLAAPHHDAQGRVDDRTAEQRRADALLAMVAQATTPIPGRRGFGSNARVFVTISLEAMLSGLSREGVDLGAKGDADNDRAVETGAAAGVSIDGGAKGDIGHGRRGCGSTAYGQTLSPSEVRMLACDAHIVPAVLGTRSELLDLGRGKRLITPAIRDALHLRHGGCTFPGCTAPPRFCDGHHVIHWARGGPTTPPNLALLCRHHHTQVHRRDHTATIDEFGVHSTRRDGSPIGNAPRVPGPYVTAA